MRGPALARFLREKTQATSQEVTWLHLEVLASSVKKEEGTVTFEATFCVEKKRKKLRETSLFSRIDGQWYYVDALSLSIVAL